MIDPKQLVVVILAGGQGRRMGGDTKPLLALGDKLLIEHVIDNAAQQVSCSTMLVNANDNLQRYQSLQLPIQTDIIANYAGPLAGVVSGMHWARKHETHVTHVITVAADTPFFPRHYVANLCNAVSDNQTLAVASYQGRSQPVFGLWPVALYAPLRHAIEQERIYKVDKFTSRYNVVDVPFAAIPIGAEQQTLFDPFFNINRPQDMAQAQRLLQLQGD